MVTKALFVILQNYMHYKCPPEEIHFQRVPGKLNCLKIQENFWLKMALERTH